jgi:hypothetical protein
MVGVGGPVANMLSYYANDFTNAFFGIAQFSPTSTAFPVNPYSGMITGIPCWNRGWYGLPWNTYISVTNQADGTGTGYAVISTIKDLNGTVILEVWGYEARDTYYACLWLHGDSGRGLAPGIVELQSAPRGLTSIILKIDYTDPKHPTYTIPECLGTISETLWDATSLGLNDVTNALKGGIHDP